MPGDVATLDQPGAEVAACTGRATPRTPPSQAAAAPGPAAPNQGTVTGPPPASHGAQPLPIGVVGCNKVAGLAHIVTIR